MRYEGNIYRNSRHVLIDDFVHYYEDFEASEDSDEW